MKYTILDDFKIYAIKSRQKRMRLRAVFQSLKKLSKFESLSDLILLTCLVIALKESRLTYSTKEVYAAFKLVSKDDYPKGQKKLVLRSLTKGSESRSVF